MSSPSRNGNPIGEWKPFKLHERFRLRNFPFPRLHFFSFPTTKEFSLLSNSGSCIFNGSNLIGNNLLLSYLNIRPSFDCHIVERVRKTCLFKACNINVDMSKHWQSDACVDRGSSRSLPPAECALPQVHRPPSSDCQSVTYYMPYKSRVSVWCEFCELCSRIFNIWITMFFDFVSVSFFIFVLVFFPFFFLRSLNHFTGFLIFHSNLTWRVVWLVIAFWRCKLNKWKVFERVFCTFRHKNMIY